MTMVEVRLADGSVIQVPYPRVPPAPSIGPRRQEIAQEWLVSLSQAPSPERVVLDLIDEHWAEHGQGPTWSQVGKQTNLDRDAVAV